MSLQVLSPDSYEELSDALSDPFERIIASDGAGGAARAFCADSFERHYEAAVPSRKSEADNLAKALQEIAVLYDWDRPNLRSPVKSSRSQKSVRNVIACFTKVPSSQVRQGALILKHYEMITMRCFAVNFRKSWTRSLVAKNESRLATSRTGHPTASS